MNTLSRHTSSANQRTARPTRWVRVIARFRTLPGVTPPPGRCYESTDRKVSRIDYLDERGEVVAIALSRGRSAFTNARRNPKLFAALLAEVA